ncbi:MAG: DinB family protein [Longimicrobiales bacterium]
MRTVIVATGLLLMASAGQAQQKASGANPASAGIQNIYNMVKGYIVRAAEQVPEDKYSFQATKDVRTFGQIVAHIADAQTNLCSAATGAEKPYSDNTEKNVKGKAALVAALKASFAACDAAYAAATDATLSNATTMFGRAGASISQVLTMNASHDFEHYGNLVTYIRLLGMVPPSSQGQ